MSYRSFEKLLTIIAPALEVDPKQSTCRTGVPPMHPVSQLEMVLTWLGGGSYRHVRMIAGISIPHFYQTLYKVIGAICNSANQSLQLRFPDTKEAMTRAAEGFKSISSDGIISGCIGCIDGWLCPIKTPWASEVQNVRSFYSGHYRRYGLNVQACCDHMSRFTAFQCRSPGGRGDAVAFLTWGIRNILENIEGPFFVIGDNAYMQSRTVMTPFNKAELKVDPFKRDNYNFFISQLRIRIEMAFGLLVNKWRVLKSPLQCKVKNCPKIIHACIRLHNFVISERIAEEGPFCIDTEVTETMVLYNDGDEISYAETEDENNVHGDEVGHDGDDTAFPEYIGDLYREVLVDHVAAHNMSRPTRNLEQN